MAKIKTLIDRVMTQEEKELLLVDLSARLPYGVIVDPVDCGKAILIGIKDKGLLLFDTVLKKEYDKPWDIEYVKPYLRPMSSMTDKERHEYDLFFSYGEHEWDNYTIADEVPLVIDWLNKKMFDYRYLIPRGLALEALEGMYKEKIIKQLLEL